MLYSVMSAEAIALMNRSDLLRRLLLNEPQSLKDWMQRPLTILYFGRLDAAREGALQLIYTVGRWSGTHRLSFLTVD
jgi:hypothetical protein